MRAAPAVAVRAAGGRAWRAVQALAPALAAGACTAWTLQYLQADLPTALGGATALAVAVALIAWTRSVPRAVHLAWDGQCWTADGSVGSLQLMIDLGPWILMRLRPDGGGALTWVACTQAEAGTAWHLLRAAVYSRPSQTTPRVLPPERAAD